MMPRSPKPTFIHELPLRTDRQKAHALVKRFDALHFPYNVVLQEMLRRLDAMRADPRYTLARSLPRTAKVERAAAFAALRREFRFTEYAAHEVVAQHLRASGYLEGLIDSHCAQTLASRAFDACEKYALSLRGRPRFNRRGQIASVEGKGPTSPLNWKDDHVVWGGKRRDRRLILRPIFDRRDTQGVEAHALASRVKYVRLIRRTISGQARFFVQLVCDGHTLRDGSGQVVQRDLYSAWLGLFIDHQANELDATQACQAWETAYPLLRAASRPVKAASWRLRGASRAPERGRAVRTQQQSERPARSPAHAREEQAVTL